MLIIKNLNFPGLLQNINLSLDSKSSKKIAILGINGSGKTTLIKEIYQTYLNPSHNKNIQINHEIIGYLEQHPNFNNKQLIGEILGESYLIDIALQQVGLPEDIIYQSPDKISGGERLKIQLVQLLLKEPTILLLDEPTNHLDAESKQFLQHFIQNFPGSVLLVSHDRHFLNQTINQIWEIDHTNQKFEVFHGSFNQWHKNRLETQSNIQSHASKIKDQVKNIHNWLKANEFHPKYRFSTRVLDQKKKLKKLQSELDSIQIKKDPKIKIKTTVESNSKPTLQLKFSFKNLQTKVYNGQKILLQGSNGSGKTTLLKYIQDPEKSEHNGSLRFLYMSQQTQLPQDKTVLELISESTYDNQTKIYQTLANLHLKHKLKSKVSQLSGGEQKRLQIAIIINSNSDIILLDEPTNHLDIFTQESIQNFILNTNKTIILVSHDTFLTSQLTKNKDFILWNI